MKPEPVNVLVVDDTPANLVALEAVLGPLGVRIVEAHSGAEAIARASEESFAVALVDVQMPEMDGFEVARRLRETATGVELPIIFLTAMHRDEEYARKGYASGAADYITKPFDPGVLRARVKAFVDLFQQRDRLRLAQVGERTRERDEALEKLAALLASERAARREAEIANRAKDEFLATVSHELRTPLSAILGWASIARQSRTSPDVDRALTTIERNARAQMRIIEDVLDVGRIVSGKLALEIAATDVAEAIEGAVQAVRPAADAKQVALAVDIASDVGVIAADVERLQQITWNLLSNAIKFTPRGGHVSVSARRTASSVTIDVQDDGQGIRAEFLPHLFEAFRQADGSTTRRQGGLGLGLAIVKQLVDCAHGGSIRARSEGEGHGSTFTVELPARTDRRLEPSNAASEAASARRPHGARRGRRRGRACSSRARAEIFWSRNRDGAERGRSLRGSERCVDVILSDISMPDVDGYTLIRTDPKACSGSRRQTPAIALTAHASHEYVQAALDSGSSAHRQAHRHGRARVGGDQALRI